MPLLWFQLTPLSQPLSREGVFWKTLSQVILMQNQGGGPLSDFKGTFRILVPSHLSPPSHLLSETLRS